jgi:hypothetical protein
MAPLPRILPHATGPCSRGDLRPPPRQLLRSSSGAMFYAADRHAKRWCRAVGSGHAADAVFHATAGVDSALANKKRLVDPGVTSITGLQAWGDPEVLIRVGSLAARLDRLLNGVIPLQHAEVRRDDESAIVGRDLAGTSSRPFRPDRSGSTLLPREDSSGDALAGYLALGDLEVPPKARLRSARAV